METMSLETAKLHNPPRIYEMNFQKWRITGCYAQNYISIAKISGVCQCVFQDLFVKTKQSSQES